MGLIELGLIIGLVLLVVFAIRGGRGDNSTPADRAPLDILRERYAKGEIDEATFERMKRELDL